MWTLIANDKQAIYGIQKYSCFHPHGVIVRIRDYGFVPRPFHFHALTTLGKLFTHIRLLYARGDAWDQAVHSKCVQ